MTMTEFLIFTLCVAGYIAIAGIIDAILDYYRPHEEVNAIIAAVWPIVLLALPFMLLFQATYWLVSYFLKDAITSKKFIEKSHQNGTEKENKL